MSSRLEGGLSVGAKVLMFLIRALAFCSFIIAAIQMYALAFEFRPTAYHDIALWVSFLLSCAVSVGLFLLANWVKKAGAQKLAKNSDHLAQFESAMGSKTDREP